MTRPPFSIIPRWRSPGGLHVAIIGSGGAAFAAATCAAEKGASVTLIEAVRIGGTGFSGAWIGNLTVLEPYRSIFIGAALTALFLAGRRIFQPVQACRPGEVCAVPQVRTVYKVMFCIVAALIVTAIAFPYVLPLFY